RAIRNIRAEKKVEPAKYIEAYVAADGLRYVVEAGSPYIEALARVRPLRVVADVSEAPRDGVAKAVLERATAVVPLAGLFDLDAERARLAKLIADAEAELARIDAKLNNDAFRSKAPPQIVAAEQERRAVAQTRLDALRASLA